MYVDRILGQRYKRDRPARHAAVRRACLFQRYVCSWPESVRTIAERERQQLLNSVVKVTL